jgi:prepilin-type N-terminal cleavage/methylation domain-containing protein
MRAGASQHGFTLAELLIGCTLGAIVMTAVMSAYLFLGRNLTRLAYNQALERTSRIALTYLTNDFKQAAEVRTETSPASPSGSRLKLRLASGVDVVYDYDATNDKLTRTAGAGPALVLLADGGSGNSRLVYCTAFDFNYYTTTQGDPTYQSTTNVVAFSVKLIEVSFTLQAGSTPNGTFTQSQSSSARFSLRNRALPTGS